MIFTERKEPILRKKYDVFNSKKKKCGVIFFIGVTHRFEYLSDEPEPIWLCGAELRSIAIQLDKLNERAMKEPRKGP